MEHGAWSLEPCHRAGAALHTELRDRDVQHPRVGSLELGAQDQLGAPIGALARVNQHEVRVVVV